MRLSLAGPALHGPIPAVPGKNQCSECESTTAEYKQAKLWRTTGPCETDHFKKKCVKTSITISTSLGHEISMPMLTSMQGKDYRAIFDTLVLTLDPCHPLKEGVRFEDGFIPALKALRYPFAHQIDTKWLAAVASPHSWPYLLSVLHWLVELCKVP